jgi:hypothetical protein
MEGGNRIRARGEACGPWRLGRRPERQNVQNAQLPYATAWRAGVRDPGSWDPGSWDAGIWDPGVWDPGVWDPGTCRRSDWRPDAWPGRMPSGG